jgi:hypothetical protein
MRPEPASKNIDSDRIYNFDDSVRQGTVLRDCATRRVVVARALLVQRRVTGFATLFSLRQLAPPI